MNLHHKSFERVHGADPESDGAGD